MVVDGTLKVGDKVTTHDGPGIVTSVADRYQTVKLDSGTIGNYEMRDLTLIPAPANPA